MFSNIPVMQRRHILGKCLTAGFYNGIIISKDNRLWRIIYILGGNRDEMYGGRIAFDNMRCNKLRLSKD